MAKEIRSKNMEDGLILSVGDVVGVKLPEYCLCDLHEATRREHIARHTLFNSCLWRVGKLYQDDPVIGLQQMDEFGAVGPDPKWIGVFHDQIVFPGCDGSWGRARERTPFSVCPKCGKLLLKTGTQR